MFDSDWLTEKCFNLIGSPRCLYLLLLLSWWQKVSTPALYWGRPELLNFNIQMFDSDWLIVKCFNLIGSLKSLLVYLWCGRSTVLQLQNHWIWKIKCLILIGWQKNVLIWLVLDPPPPTSCLHILSLLSWQQMVSTPGLHSVLSTTLNFKFKCSTLIGRQKKCCTPALYRGRPKLVFQNSNAWFWLVLPDAWLCSQYPWWRTVNTPALYC